MTVDAAALGSFLKARRAARSPEAAGLPGGGRRRTPGLRREELAALAGVSIDYLTRLEQGRHREPSVEVLASLATALGLTPDGRRYLFGLGGRQDPGPVIAARQSVPPALRRLVARMDPSPAWILNRRRDILVWNRGAEAMLGDLGALPESHRNQLYLTFSAPAARRLWTNWQVVAQDAVAQLREVVARASHSPEVQATIEQYVATSPEFASLWARQDVARSCTAHRAVSHPGAGELLFETALLDTDDGDLQIVVLEPADADTTARWSAHLATNASPRHGLRSV